MAQGKRILDRFEAAREWGEQVTVVGHGMTLDGKVSSGGTVIVAGRVKGAVDSEQLVRVLPGGIISGPIKALAVLVEGAVDGDIAVEDQFELTHTGRVRGDVEGPRIAVAEGAYLKGMLRATAGQVRHFREKRSG